LLIEEEIRGLGSGDLSPENLERTVQKMASSLDNKGHNVSLEAGNMLQLRWALAARIEVGRPMLDDFNAAISSLELEDMVDTYYATSNVIGVVGEAWPKLKKSERKEDVLRIVKRTKLDLLIARAKSLSEDEGIRSLIAEAVPCATIIEELGISDDKYGQVNAAVEAERAERKRAKALLDDAADSTIEEKVKNLITNSVADDLIIELAEVDQGTVDGVKESLKEELEEKKRLEEEAAAKKKAEAEGPAVADIPADQLLEYIESLREIMEFSDKENEIRSMCEQSSIPKSLVDIAVAEPDKLDELEKNADG
jgi:hypothetical protein